jgi:hypothetical protein
MELRWPRRLGAPWPIVDQRDVNFHLALTPC